VENKESAEDFMERFMASLRLAPPTLSSLEANDAAFAIRAAMKGPGTNDDELIEQIADKSDVDMQLIVAAWNAKVKRDLIKDLKHELSGHYEDVMVMLVKPIAQVDAEWLHFAMKGHGGIGTNESMLTDVLCTRSPFELRNIADAYDKLYGVSLVAEIRGEVSGNLENVYMAVLSSPRDTMPDAAQDQKDCTQLFDAGVDKIGTDEAAFIRILAENPREHVMAVARLYEQANGKTLVEAIQSETSGHFQRALVALAKEEYVHHAEQLHSAMKGLGTNDRKLMHTMVTCRGPLMKRVATAFRTLYGKPLENWIEGDTSFKYETALLAILQQWT